MVLPSSCTTLLRSVWTFEVEGMTWTHPVPLGRFKSESKRARPSLVSVARSFPLQIALKESRATPLALAKLFKKSSTVSFECVEMARALFSPPRYRPELPMEMVIDIGSPRNDLPCGIMDSALMSLPPLALLEGVRSRTSSNTRSNRAHFNRSLSFSVSML